MEATWQALSAIPDCAMGGAILDIGCGSGAQTLDLAARTTGTITAVDNYQPFLDELASRAIKWGLQGRIRTLCASMDGLPFEEGQFDLIWSEGAIFIVGFEKGLALWRKFCRKGGYIVVSNAALFEDTAPEEVLRFWEDAGDPLDTEAEMREQVRRAGLRLVTTFRLPEAGWLEYYFKPLIARVTELEKTHGSAPACAPLLAFCRHEAEMYAKYKRYYGYTFFIMQNPLRP